MELKKSPKADMQNKKVLFFEIGLVVSLLAVMGMFAWGEQEKRVEKIDMGYMIEEVVLPEVTRPENEPPAKPEIKPITIASDHYKVVPNDATIDITWDIPDPGDDIIILPPPTRDEPVVDDAPYVSVSQMPQFMGGTIEDFHRWVQGKVSYPSMAAENRIEGRVVVKFVIEKDGTLTNIEVFNAPDRLLEEEVIRVLKSSPKWTAGMNGNVPARVQYSIPVIFRLQ